MFVSYQQYATVKWAIGDHVLQTGGGFREIWIFPKEEPAHINSPGLASGLCSYSSTYILGSKIWHFREWKMLLQKSLK